MDSRIKKQLKQVFLPLSISSLGLGLILKSDSLTCFLQENKDVFITGWSSYNSLSFLGISYLLFSVIDLFLTPFILKSKKRITNILTSIILFHIGGILYFQGWRMDPILVFSFYLITAILITTLRENLILKKNL
tara:strand:+ start:281 stop:682 length:402 start_codon:yes stop_codon:yes gene_type:complete